MWDLWWTKWHWAGFLRVLQFPLPVYIPPTVPHSSYIIRGWYKRPNSGRRTKCTQSHPIRKKNKGYFKTLSESRLCSVEWRGETWMMNRKELLTTYLDISLAGLAVGVDEIQTRAPPTMNVVLPLSQPARWCGAFWRCFKRKEENL
jgi:hypothetical protein